MPTSIVPLKQGDLDGLCSLYACFNAVRWIKGDKFMSVQHDYLEACEIFSLPFMAKIATLETVLHGANTSTVIKTLNLLQEHYPTFEYRQLKRKENLLKLIDKGPVILGFTGMDSHWTVITHYDDTHYYLFDSSGYSKFKREDVVFNCKKPDENKICVVYRDVISVYPKIKA